MKSEALEQPKQGGQGIINNFSVLTPDCKICHERAAIKQMFDQVTNISCMRLKCNYCQEIFLAFSMCYMLSNERVI